MKSTFVLLVERTHYRKGFFNVPVAHNGFVSDKDEPIDVHLGDGGEVTRGRINHRAQRNGTARIHVGAALRDYFQTHFQEGDQFEVEVLNPTSIRISGSGQAAATAHDPRDYVRDEL